MEGLAKDIGTDIQEAALGIIRVVNASMERAIRAISLERGYDPREFTLLPFGGAGPMHCCELAQELRIPRILVPSYPGILSALGVAIADIVKDYSRTVMLRGDDISQKRLDDEFAMLEGQAREDMGQEELNVEHLLAQRSLDVRYVGQSYELAVDYPYPPQSPLGIGNPPLPPFSKGGLGGFGRGARSEVRRRDLNRAIAHAFHRAHRQRFGYADPSERVEIVNLRLKMAVPVDKPLPEPEATAGESPKDAQTGEAGVVFREGTFATSCYLRDRLHCGNRIPGPALVLQMDSTTVIPPGWVAEVDKWKNLVMTPLR